MTIKNTIGDLFTNEKLDINYDIKYQKIQFFFWMSVKCLEHLMVFMFLEADKDNDDKDVIATEQYQESLNTWLLAWSNRSVIY